MIPGIKPSPDRAAKLDRIAPEYRWTLDGLVLHLWMGEGAGPPRDISGNGNHATLPGGTSAPAWVFSEWGVVLDFDGSNDFLILPDSPSLNITTNITMSAWIKTSEPDSTQMNIIGGYDRISPFNGYGFGVSIGGGLDGKLKYWDSSSWVSSSTAVNDGAWHLVAVSVNGSNATFYLDGQSDGSPEAGNPDSFSGDRAIGARADDANNPFLGLIDDVRIYNRALTAAEVFALYELGFKMLDPYWRYWPSLITAPTAAPAQAVRPLSVLERGYPRGVMRGIMRGGRM